MSAFEADRFNHSRTSPRRESSWSADYFIRYGKDHGAAVVPLRCFRLSNFQLGCLANKYCHFLAKQAATVGVSQLDIVGTGSKREFFGLLDPVGKAAIDINRSILIHGLDFDVPEVCRHVIRFIGVRIRIIEERIEDPNRLNNHNVMPGWLSG